MLALREVAAIHGWAISQMVQMVDPELVVLAGPLTTLGQVYLDSVTNIALQFESDYHPTRADPHFRARGAVRRHRRHGPGAGALASGGHGVRRQGR